jgi:hypothetical protein
LAEASYWTIESQKLRWLRVPINIEASPILRFQANFYALGVNTDVMLSIAKT